MAFGGIDMSLKHAEQQQKMYEAKTADEALAIVRQLLTGGSWDGEPVPEHVMSITVIPHQEVGPRIAGELQVGVMYVTLE